MRYPAAEKLEIIRSRHWKAQHCTAASRAFGASPRDRS